MKNLLDVTEILTEDHRTVSRLFEEMDLQDSLETKQSLFDEIFGELEAHSNAEETVLYPRTEDLEPTEELTEQSYEEHAMIRQKLHQLQSIEIDSTKFDIVLAELRKTVEHHVREEEGRLFPALRRVFKPEDLKKMGEDIESAKQRYRKAG